MIFLFIVSSHWCSLQSSKYGEKEITESTFVADISNIPQYLVLS